ncbi:MAG: hypothetical protein AB7P08_18635 [Burkholderiales bacterium]
MSCKSLGWAWRQPVSPSAKLVLIAMADGIEHLDEIASHTGLSSSQVIDALSEIGKAMLVIWKHRRPFFRLGEGYQDNSGRAIDEA